jgi:hypothetical protein
MVRERKNQLGSSNLSARLDNTSFGSNTSTIQSNEFLQPVKSPTGTFIKSLTNSLIAPDVFNNTSTLSKAGKKKETATWKPAPIYERDYETVHRTAFTDPHTRVDHRPPSPKSTYEIAEENIALQEEKVAVDNLCKLIRSTYGTCATMVRSVRVFLFSCVIVLYVILFNSFLFPQFNKKNTDNFSLYEFNQYIKRNHLETYLPEKEQKLIFAYIDKHNPGSIPVKDFLRTVEEHEFHDYEMNKESVKIRDFLAMHINQKKFEEEEKNRQNPLEGEELELDNLKKQKGIENEATKIRKALGMNTFNIDVDHKQFNEVIEEVYYHKLPTNEIHRKYARFLHHSNLKLSQVPYYDVRSEELDRLKLKAAQIDQMLESDEMKGRFTTLRASRDSLLHNRLNNSSLLTSSLNSETDLPKDVTNYDFDQYDQDKHSEIANVEVKDNHHRHGSAAAAVPRPMTTSAKNIKKSDHEPDLGLGPPPKSAAGNNNKDNNNRMAMSKSLPNLNLSSSSLSARPSPLAFLDNIQVNTNNAGVSNSASFSPGFQSKAPSPLHQINGFRDLSGGGAGGAGGNNSVPKPNKPSLQPLQTNGTNNGNGNGPVSFSPKKINKKDRGQSFLEGEENSIISSSQKHQVFHDNNNNNNNPELLLTGVRRGGGNDGNDNQSQRTGATKETSPSKQSKLLSTLLEPQEGALKETDFYMHVIDENASMGRLKDPSKVMRIEKIDPKVYASTGKKIVHSKGPTDFSRMGIGGGSDNSSGYYSEAENPTTQDQFTTTNSHYYPPLNYQPSQPVTRELISESSLIYQEKAYKRHQRYQRTQANLEITRQRIESDQLEKQMRSLRREATRIEDSIRYKTSVLLNDLYAFKSQPLQRMAKRQNLHLSDRMWNGSHDKQTVVLVNENRDFHTTYNSSFLEDGPSPATGNGDHHHHNSSTFE